MIDIIKGSTQKPISSQQLINVLSTAEALNGVLYVGYPIFSTPEGRFPIDAIFISPQKGIVLIDMVEGRSLPENYPDVQDDIFNKLTAKLRNHKELMRGRTLDVPISILTFAPAVTTGPDIDADYPVCSASTLMTAIDRIEGHVFEKYNPVLSVIQSVSTIRKGIKKRNTVRSDSRGAKLQRLEDSIANLDNQQSRAVIETTDTVQRIRGLAGSGKTIVLALKAAYLHAQHPEWKVAVTFHTRSLKGQFKRLINTFTIEQTGEEPDWENLKIIHAWGAGAGDREGIYYNFCKQNEVEYLDFGSAKRRFGSDAAFDDACSTALKTAKQISSVYDAILIDEAQDFPSSFLQLCFSMLREKKRLVYAYDELQTLSSNSLPSPEKIFGSDKDGELLVRLTEKSQDIILEKCYRNSRPVLTTAHALGFGIYRDMDPKIQTGLIQMFDNKELWKDVGYAVVAGELTDGEAVTLERTTDSSPEFLENHSDVDDLIQFRAFDSEDEQARWVIENIRHNLSEDELRFDDIIVINPDPIKTKKSVGAIRAGLFKHKINSHLAGVDTTPDVFFSPASDSIAFTGIHRAKGNEAGMVYIINAQDCYKSFGSLATVRNRLFTAITRSKAWVRVLGVGEDMHKLKSEFDQIKEKKFRLEFTYPTAALRRRLNIINRDMSEYEKHNIKKAESSLETFLATLGNGDVNIEDLDMTATQIEKLEQIVLQKKGVTNGCPG